MHIRMYVCMDKWHTYNSVEKMNTHHVHHGGRCASSDVLSGRGRAIHELLGGPRLAVVAMAKQARMQKNELQRSSENHRQNKV